VKDEMRGRSGVHDVVPVAEGVHSLGWFAKDRDLAPDHATVRVLRPAGEVGCREPSGAPGQQLEREHGRGHGEPAYHHRVRSEQVGVAELPLLAAQVKWADYSLRQVFGLQMPHDARLHVRQHSACIT